MIPTAALSKSTSLPVGKISSRRSTLARTEPLSGATTKPLKTQSLSNYKKRVDSFGSPNKAENKQLTRTKSDSPLPASPIKPNLFRGLMELVMHSQLAEWRSLADPDSEKNVRLWCSIRSFAQFERVVELIRIPPKKMGWDPKSKTLYHFYWDWLASFLPQPIDLFWYMQQEYDYKTSHQIRIEQIPLSSNNDSTSHDHNSLDFNILGYELTLWFFQCFPWADHNHEWYVYDVVMTNKPNATTTGVIFITDGKSRKACKIRNVDANQAENEWYSAEHEWTMTKSATTMGFCSNENDPVWIRHAFDTNIVMIMMDALDITLHTLLKMFQKNVELAQSIQFPLIRALVALLNDMKAHGFIHGDLHSSNIMLTIHPGLGDNQDWQFDLSLIDFGRSNCLSTSQWLPVDAVVLQQALTHYLVGQYDSVKRNSSRRSSSVWQSTSPQTTKSVIDSVFQRFNDGDSSTNDIYNNYAQLVMNHPSHCTTSSKQRKSFGMKLRTKRNVGADHKKTKSLW